MCFGFFFELVYTVDYVNGFSYCLQSCACLLSFGYTWWLLIWVSLSGVCLLFPWVASSGPCYSRHPVRPSDHGICRGAGKVLICCHGCSRFPGMFSHYWVLGRAAKVLPCMLLFSWEVFRPWGLLSYVKQNSCPCPVCSGCPTGL